MLYDTKYRTDTHFQTSYMLHVLREYTFVKHFRTMSLRYVALIKKFVGHRCPVRCIAILYFIRKQFHDLIELNWIELIWIHEVDWTENGWKIYKLVMKWQKNCTNFLLFNAHLRGNTLVICNNSQFVWYLLLWVSSNRIGFFSSLIIWAFHQPCNKLIRPFQNTNTFAIHFGTISVRLLFNFDDLWITGITSID